MDLFEDQDRFVLRADLPGVGEDDVRIELEETVLTIAGERLPRGRLTQRPDASRMPVRVRLTA